VALCFLRKLNRDKVTQRSVELPAAARPMVAEKTPEHDELFVDGVEYLSFSSEDELVARVRGLLQDPTARAALAAAGRARALRSGYSSVDRAKQMLETILATPRP
jgi:spore maturation protein CgeB